MLRAGPQAGWHQAWPGLIWGRAGGGKAVSDLYPPPNQTSLGAVRGWGQEGRPQMSPAPYLDSGDTPSGPGGPGEGQAGWGQP